MEQLRWAKEELKTLDSMTRKVLIDNELCFPFKKRSYVSREDQGREPISCEGCVRGEVRCGEKFLGRFTARGKG